MYTIWFCWRGNKLYTAVGQTYESKGQYLREKAFYTYDIIDEDEHNVWFDYGKEDEWRSF